MVNDYIIACSNFAKAVKDSQVELDVDILPWINCRGYIDEDMSRKVIGRLFGFMVLKGARV